jgi:hypothetical protein
VNILGLVLIAALSAFFILAGLSAASLFVLALGGVALLGGVVVAFDTE